MGERRGRLLRLLGSLAILTGTPTTACESPSAPDADAAPGCGDDVRLHDPWVYKLTEQSGSTTTFLRGDIALIICKHSGATLDAPPIFSFWRPDGMEPLLSPVLESEAVPRTYPLELRGPQSTTVDYGVRASYGYKNNLFFWLCDAPFELRADVVLAGRSETLRSEIQTTAGCE